MQGAVRQANRRDKIPPVPSVAVCVRTDPAIFVAVRVSNLLHILCVTRLAQTSQTFRQICRSCGSHGPLGRDTHAAYCARSKSLSALIAGSSSGVGVYRLWQWAHASQCITFAVLLGPRES